MKEFLEIDLMEVINGEEAKYVNLFTDVFMERFKNLGIDVYFLKNKLDYKMKRGEIKIDESENIVCFTIITLEVNNSCSLDLFKERLENILQSKAI